MESSRESRNFLMIKMRATAATPSRVSMELAWLTTSCRAMAKSSTSVTARGVWRMSIFTNSRPTTMFMVLTKKSLRLNCASDSAYKESIPVSTICTTVTSRMNRAMTSSRIQAVLSRYLTTVAFMRDAPFGLRSVQIIADGPCAVNAGRA